MSGRGKFDRVYIWRMRCCVCRRKYYATRRDKLTCGARCRQAKKRGGIHIWQFKPKAM